MTPNPSPNAGAALHALTEAQTGIWLALILSTNKSLYNIGEAIEIRGPLDVVRFETALRNVVAKTDALHLQFVETEHGPRQFFSPRLPWSLKILDLSAAEDPDSAAADWMQQAMRGIVDLAREPLFDYALLKIRSELYIWYARYHHLCTDGFGVSLISRRVASMYSAAEAGLPLPQENPGSWQTLLERELLYRRSPQFERDRQYWRSQIAALPERATLAGRPPHWPDSFEKCSAELTHSVSDRLRVLAASRRMSVAQVLAASVSVYCQKMTGTRELLLGMTVTARSDETSQCVVGMVSNVVPLRVNVDPEADLDSLLRQVSTRLREAVFCQRYRAEELRRDLGLHPSQPELFGPLVNVCSFDYDFNFAGLPARARNVGHWRVDDLEYVFYDRRDRREISIDLCANPSLYTRSEVRSHLERFIRLLGGMVEAEPNTPIHRLELLACEERQRVLDKFNATETPIRPQLVHELFELQVKRTPDAIALAFEQETLSYSELNQRANRLAHHLIEHGIGPDDRVAVCMERSLEMVVALLGILKAGAAYVPLDPEYPMDRIAFMLKDSDPKLIVIQEKLHRILPQHESRIVALRHDVETDSIARQPAHNPTLRPRGLSPSNLAYVIYTSGSTGQPKGVMNEHGAVVNCLLWMQRQYPLSTADRVLQKTPFGFDVSALEFFAPLLAGATLIVARPGGHQDPGYLIELIARAGVTQVHFVPSMLQIFLNQLERGQCIGLKHIICIGEDLPAPVARQCLEALPQVELHNLYGPTEAAIFVTYWDCCRNYQSKRIPIGRPISNCRIYVMDEYRQPVPIGVSGEIYIGGMCVARGYLNRAELTAERFTGDCFSDAPSARVYRTGDIGRWLDDGSLEYLGRNDQQIKLRGTRIELGEIEATLRACPGVGDAAVVLREDRTGDKRLVGYAVCRGSGGVSGDGLRSALAQQLPEIMVPSAILILPSLPLTRNGKLDRKALPEPDRAAYLIPVQAESLESIQTEMRKDARVKDALAIAIDHGGRRLIAGYIVKREDTVNAARLEHSSRWQQIYDIAYTSAGAAPTDFDISGWHSSYTGRPIDSGEMRLWVEEQTARIRALRPRRVLEIGCGTGLLLTRLAGTCTSYLGVDFSGKALALLRGYLAQRPDLSHVDLRQAAANELGFVADASVDMVILNSVVQYFPDVDYLIDALSEAVRVTEPGGHIFVGDVRNLLLLDAYHTSVQLYRASSELSAIELVRRISRAKLNEEELLVDPALFSELLARWENIARIHFSPKVGAYDNEVSRFRYDVTLEVGVDKTTLREPDLWISWDADGDWQRELRRQLVDKGDVAIGLRGIRDIRVASSIEASRALRDADSALTTVADLRAAANSTSGVDPGDLQRLADELGVQICWRPFAGDGTCEAILNPRWSATEATLLGARKQHFRRMVNHPQSHHDISVSTAITHRLQQQFPKHAVPTRMFTLHEWPLTELGEIDRDALPVFDLDGPTESATPNTEYRAPQTPTEYLLTAIWAETLGIEQIGIDENFFDLGGHSLLAMQMFTRIGKTFGRKLPMASLFQAPTVRCMARTIEQGENLASWACLRAIRSGGSRAPLFLVPGVGGNVICYYQLTQLLEDQQPVYGLQSYGLDGLAKPYTSVRDIAAHFVRDIRKVQPEGPYYLGGTCIGGVFAFEMAQQLVAAGQQVAMLALIECWPPSVHRARVLPMYWPPSFAIPIAIVRGTARLIRTLPGLRPGRWHEHLRAKWKSARQITQRQRAYDSESQPAYTDMVTRSNFWAMFKYFPKSFLGRLVLIMATERPLNSRRDARLDWQHLARHGSQVHYSGGSDSGNMLTMPHVQRLARLLAREIDLARDGSNALDKHGAEVSTSVNSLEAPSLAAREIDSGLS